MRRSWGDCDGTRTMDVLGHRLLERHRESVNQEVIRDKFAARLKVLPCTVDETKRHPKHVRHASKGNGRLQSKGLSHH